MEILTGIDVLGVQRYVFASNRLRDVIAASWLVHWATALDGALRGSGGKVLLASGGNAILVFSNETQARQFAANYSRRLHDEAPGLEVALAHRPFSQGHLAAEIKHLLQIDLVRAKLERVPSAPQQGLSVTATCRITGLPATGMDPQNQAIPLSNMVCRWRDRDVQQSANLRWMKFIQDGGLFSFPPEIDDMGRSRGDTSLIGVVHVDGNGIGKKISRWLSQCVENEQSDKIVRTEMFDWSRALDQAGRRVFEVITNRVVRAIIKLDARYKIEGSIAKLGFDLSGTASQTRLPLRPVLLGGDDLTFLCDGRIALDLAGKALDAFSSHIPNLGQINACAGVALVPSHTPFVRAYELAKALCGNAKQRRHEMVDDGPWIDWHIGTSGPGERIRNLRERVYTHRSADVSYQLTCRPYRLGASADERETWRWLSQTVLGTGKNGFRSDEWQQHRNKLKDLASIVREGPDGILHLRDSWTTAKELPWPKGLQPEHAFFDSERTPLLDAVELLDLHLPLSEEAP